MSHFYSLTITRWKRWSIVVVFALFTALFLWNGQAINSTMTLKEQETVLVKGNQDEPYIGLTFNISWGDEKVHDILKQLKEHNVQATFFVSGEWAERHPEIVEKITKEKHELGSLGYRYKSYLDQELEQVQKDLTYSQEIFQKLDYEEVDLLRAPSGHLSEEIVELAEGQGYQVIQWNVNPSDWENPGSKEIVDHVMNETTNGDIILMHASDSAKQTAKSLKTILPGLKNKGHQFVTISELLNQAHAESELVE